MTIDPRLTAELEQHPYPLLFATISGAHLYGFASPDSDYDIRGAHVLPTSEVVGMKPLQETVESSEVRGGMQIDLVTHDIKKFFTLLLKNNGYVLEQLYSPLIARSGSVHQELKSIARRCITRHHAHHYLGFAATQWKLFAKEEQPRVKPLLYVYRVLLTGIYLMKSGRVEANLEQLNAEFKLPQVPGPISAKVSGSEKGALGEQDIQFHRKEYERLRKELENAFESSSLPETPSAHSDLNDLLVRTRMNSPAQQA
jgi:uncharacterized protein